MMKSRSSRLTVAVFVAGAVIVLAGSAAVASNMGFKINKPMVIAQQGTGASPSVGRNWVSLPYQTPYGTIAGLCTQAGLPLAVALPPRPGATVSWQENVAGTSPPNDVVRSGQCGTAGANIALPSGALTRFIDIKIPSTASPLPASLILVGSHNPTQSFTIPVKATAPPEEDFWFSVPYHTTAVNAADLCAQLGLTTVSVFPPRAGAQVIRNQTDGLIGGSTTFPSWTCGTTGSTPFNLVLGEGVIIRQTVSPVTVTPAHF